jgi:hypothetical protein
MLIGCGDCLQTGQCSYKVLSAVILASDSPDGTGSYCPGVYNCSGDDGCVGECSAVANMIAWVNSQSSTFQNDADFPWGTCQYAIFGGTGDTSPSSIVGPGAGDCTYGGPQFGSAYATGSPITAQYGAAEGGPVCAIVNLVAIRMTGSLFLTPESIYGASSGGDPITESCLLAANAPCSPSDQQVGDYYPPLPPADLCGNLPFVLSDGYQIQYLPYASAGTECATVGIVLTYPGGSYTNCQSPDPFFGDDPP